MTPAIMSRHYRFEDATILIARVLRELRGYVRGAVEYAFITSQVRLRRKRDVLTLSLYQVALVDGEVFSSPTKPAFYDLQNRRIAAFDPKAGSVVNIHLDSKNWMDAVQVVTDAPEKPSPFLPAGCLNPNGTSPT